MQSVNEKWYNAYRWVAAGFAVLFLAASLSCWFIPSLSDYGHRYGLNYATGVISLFVILYAVLVYNVVARKRTPAEAMLGQAFIQALGIVNVTQATGNIDSIYVVGWIGMALLGGMFGLYATAGVPFLAAFYYILDTSRPDGHSAYTTSGVLALLAISLASVIGHFFWRSKFVDQESARVASLRGELKTNQKQSEILVKALSDGVILIDTEGVIRLMNPAAAQMTGWTVEDATGTDYRSVITLKNEDSSDITSEDNPITRIFENQAGTTKVLQLITRNSQALVVSLVTSPVLNPKTKELNGVVAVLRDISITHQSEKQRAEFISTASHEMRTPVAAIEGYLQLALNDKVSQVDPKAREFLTKALDSTHHLGKLFQDLLTSAKAEDGRLVSHPTVVEMGSYIEALAETFKFSAEKKGLLTDFIFGTSSNNTTQTGEHIIRPLYYVHVDADRLREVITNLFDNAVKYTPSGKISVGLTGNMEVVQLFVRDTGPGIPPEDVPHLFQKFYRVDNSATRTIGGTGLGLFISKKIIELYNGRIWVESALGKGSTFYINLPRLSTQRAEALKAAEAQSAASDPITSLTTPV